MTPTRTVATSEVKQPTMLPRGDTVRNMLQGDGTYATVLLVWALDHFGIDADTGQPCVFVWAPDTIRQEIKTDTGVLLPKRNFDKLMAAVAIITTDSFFKNVSRFIQLANILAGDEFDPAEFDMADSVECAWAITEGLLLWPPDDDDPEPFCDDIRHYIGHVLREEGYVTPPDILRVALDADFSAKVQYGFSDDPEMFSAIYANQKAKADDVTSVITDGLSEMLSQLKALNLKDGSTEDVEKKIAQVLQQASAKAKQGDRL